MRFERWGGLDLMGTVDKVSDIAHEWGVRPGVLVKHPELRGMNLPDKARARGCIVIDAVGMGGGVADRLKQLGYVVDEYIGGAFAVRGKKEFINQRAASFWRLRELLESRRIAFPAEPRLVEELLALRWRDLGGRIALEQKDKLKSRLGRSPDAADALAMAFASDALRYHGVMIASPWG